MFMEDVIRTVAENRFNLPAYESKFVQSLSNRLEYGHGLTTRQGRAFIKMLGKMSWSDSGLGKRTFEEVLADPKWKDALIPSVTHADEVRHIGDNVLAFRTSNSEINRAFDDSKIPFKYGFRIIVISNQKDLDQAITFIGKYGFQMDSTTEQYLMDILDNAETKAKSTMIMENDEAFFFIPNEPMLAQFIKHVLEADYL
jgi:hypothetical protein